MLGRLASGLQLLGWMKHPAMQRGIAAGTDSYMGPMTDTLSRGFARAGAKPLKLNKDVANPSTQAAPEASTPQPEILKTQAVLPSEATTANESTLPESELQLNKLKKKSGKESLPYEARVKAEQESNLRMAKDRYLNKTRQVKYHNKAESRYPNPFTTNPSLQHSLCVLIHTQTHNKEEVRYDSTPTQEKLLKNIKKTKSVNGVLNTFERDRFYMSTDLLLSTCAQFLKVQKSFRKMKIINQIDAMKKGVPAIPKIPKATFENDKRVQTLVSTIQRSVGEMNPSELCKAAWVLTKGSHFLQAEDIVFKIQKKLIDMPMDTENSYVCFCIFCKVEPSQTL